MVPHDLYVYVPTKGRFRVCHCQRTNLLPRLTPTGCGLQGPCMNRSSENTGAMMRLLTQGADSAPPLSSTYTGPVRSPSTTESMLVS